MRAPHLIYLSACLLGCTSYSAKDRSPSDRTPITAASESLDPTRCLLPFPSNTFTKLDSSSTTGLRLALDISSFMPTDDNATLLNFGDGFSRSTPLMSGFMPFIDPTTLGVPDPLGTGMSSPVPNGETPAVRLLVAQPGAADFATDVPLRTHTVNDDEGYPVGTSLLISYPARVLAPASDYVAVVFDSIRDVNGKKYSTPHAQQVALGLADPESQAEANLRGYHAPTRAVLKAAKIDPHHVLRAWTFTTRSSDDATKRLSAMINAMTAAVTAGQITVTIDTIALGTAPIAAIVNGHISGAPQFVAPDGSLSMGDDGMPVAMGVANAPFRVVVPVGTGDYHVIYFGHGTAGNINDGTFDTEFAAHGAAKLSFQFDGWTDNDFVQTFAGVVTMFKGSTHFAALTLQSLARGTAIQALLGNKLADLLSSATVTTSTGAIANPVAGRKPNLDIQVYAGGSLGGTMGLVIASSYPNIDHAVLNVAGAGWTHFMPNSVIYKVADTLLQTPYGTRYDGRMALAMTQGIWDEMDGASWTGKRSITALIQESIGDPVLPNVGTELVANVLGADQLGVVLSPIEGSTAITLPTHASAITQYKVPSTFSTYQTHGFIECNSGAGNAAKAQAVDFIQSVYDGNPTINYPAACTATPDGSCDFSKIDNKCN